MASVVNVNITGSDELSATVTRAEQSVQRFGQTVNAQTAPLLRYEQGAVKARAALGPLQSGISELTGAMRQHSPAAAAAVSAIDNLSITMIAAAASTGTWAGAIRVMMGILNPWVLLITGVGTALAFFIAQSRDAAKAQEDFNNAMKSGNLDFFKDKIKTANEELRKYEEHFEKIIKLQEQATANAPSSGPLARAQEAGLEGLRKKLAEVSAAATQANKDIETARRGKALEELPEIEATLAAQLKLSQARERDRPIIEAQNAIQKLRAKGLNEEDIAAASLMLTQTGLAKQREIDTKAAEEAAKKSVELNQRQSEAVGKTRDEIAKLNLTLAEQAEKATLVSGPTNQLKLALIEQEDATRRAAFANDKLLTPGLIALLDKLKALKIDELNAADAIKQREIATRRANLVMQEQLNLLNLVAEANSFVPAMYANLQRIDQERIQSLQELGNAQADYLQLIGKTREAEQLRLATTIQNLRELRKQTDDVTRQSVIDQQIQNAETALQKVGNVTIDIGAHVARSLDDIFTSLISGTLKAVDVGKAVTATFGRIVTDIFSQTIKDKLKFELDLFNNLKQLPTQANNALAAGGGGGGLAQTLFAGAAGTPGTTTTGGGGVANAAAPLGWLANLIKTPVSIGAGTATSIGGLLAGGFGGFGIGSMLGGLIGGKGSQGSLIGGGLGAVGGIGGALLATTYIGTIITETITGLVAAAVGTLSAGTGALIGQMALPWLPGIGAIIGAIIGGLIGLFTKQDPSAIARAAFTGVRFDELAAAFDPGTLSVAISGKGGISKGKLTQIHNEVSTFLAEQLVEWTNILNLFPDIVQEEMIPALDITNAKLNAAFSRLKFSEGGSRSIKEEIAALKGPAGQAQFLEAFLPPFVTGIGTALHQAGIIVHEQLRSGIAHLGAPTDEAGFDKLLESFTEFIALASSLSEQPLGKFLTEADFTALTQGFGQLASISVPEDFIKGLEDLKEGVKPFVEFLAQAMQQTADVLGRGIMAALEAVSESDAQLAFFNSLNQGIKDAVFGGLRDSIIATAEFTDLFAPLQQAIRESVQSSLSSGAFDTAAFNQSVLPAIEAILSRAETLRPLIDELQRFGQSINQRLGFGAVAVAEVVTEPIAEELTESATLFGQSLIAAMEQATQSEAMASFTNAFNVGIKNAVFSGLVESFLATGFVDQMLAPIRDAITQGVTESRETGEFRFPDVSALVEGASAAAASWAPLIEFLHEFSLGIRDTLGLLPPPAAPAPAGPANVVINLNGVGNVDQGSIPELARRLNFMLEPSLAPRA